MYIIHRTRRSQHNISMSPLYCITSEKVIKATTVSSLYALKAAPLIWCQWRNTYNKCIYNRHVWFRFAFQLLSLRVHYSDVIMARWRLKSPASRLFTQPFIQARIKENFKAPRYRPLCGEFTGDRWIPRTNGQLCGKCFHLMTSSCEHISWNVLHTWLFLFREWRLSVLL